MMDKLTFKSIDDNGKEVEYEIISLLDSEDGSKNYIFYTDNKLENEKNRVFVSLYKKIGDDIEITPIRTKEDWDFVIGQLKSKKEEV